MEHVVLRQLRTGIAITGKSPYLRHVTINETLDNGIRIFDAIHNQLELDNVEMLNCGGVGLHVDLPELNITVNMRYSSVTAASNTGVLYKSTGNIVIYNSTVSHCGKSGVEIFGNEQAYVTLNKMNLIANGKALYLEEVRSTTMTECTIERNLQANTDIIGMSEMRGNVMVGNISV